MDLNEMIDLEKKSETLDDKVNAFQQSITPDLYKLDEFIAWQDVENKLRTLGSAIRAVQELASFSECSPETVANTLENQPAVYDVFRALLAVNGAVGFEDGRELPERLPKDVGERKELAGLLVDLGIQRILVPNVDISALLRVALIAQGANRRRFQIKGRFEKRVMNLLDTTLQTASQKLGLQLRKLSLREIPQQARGIDYVLAVNDLPFAAVAMVFQTQSGGRQQRDLSLTYPSLQKRLDEVPMGLILIADGRGVKQTPKRVLRNLLQEVSESMTLRQAETGLLEEAIVSLASRRGLRQGLNIPLNRIISNALQDGRVVSANNLPVTTDLGTLALAQYVENHPDLALALTPDSSALTWTRAGIVKKALTLSKLGNNGTSNVQEALSIFSSLLQFATESLLSLVEADSLHGALLNVGSDTVLPQSMLVVSVANKLDSVILRRVARQSLQSAPESKLAVLIVPKASDAILSSALQSTLVVNVVIIDYADILHIAQSAVSPRDSFVSMIVERSDLTKVSPFVVRSVTPRKMFFGREVEQATLIGTLATNSVALLGGRRIGKTSLLQRAKTRLEEADFRPFFLDCQTVGSWSDFGRMARLEWRVEVPDEFRPHDLFEILVQLHDGHDRPLVFLLDEVDHLLQWDQNHVENGVREAFFRACRTISQENKAQFVFSGERTIAQKLWDPHSPHWNFCRPLPLQQLSREAAERLLLDTFRSLQIRVDEVDAFRSAIWGYTSGHPQIVQALGDRLVKLLNDRPKEARGLMRVDDLKAVVEQFDYAEHYLETYWGQATTIEKLISVLVAGGTQAPYDMVTQLRGNDVLLTEDEVVAALRMLELYGIIRREVIGYTLKAEWFLEALSYYGGIEQSKQLFIDKIL